MRPSVIGNQLAARIPDGISQPTSLRFVCATADLSAVIPAFQMAARLAAKQRRMIWGLPLFLAVALPFAGCTVTSQQAAKPGRPQTLAASGPQPLQIDTTQGNRFRPETASWKALREQHVVMQKYDYSCGAAALTTIMRYYFEDDMTEQQVLDAIFRRLHSDRNAEQLIKDRMENGLSMLDLQQVAADLGYQSAVAKISLEEAQQLKAPVLVRIIQDDFRHFVVYRGMVDDRVFLADPIRGNIRLPVTEFAAQWMEPAEPGKGVALFLGKAGFGLPEQHPLALDVQSPVRHELQAARRQLFPLW